MTPPAAPRRPSPAREANHAGSFEAQSTVNVGRFNDFLALDALKMAPKRNQFPKKEPVDSPRRAFCGRPWDTGAPLEREYTYMRSNGIWSWTLGFGFGHGAVNTLVSVSSEENERT